MNMKKQLILSLVVLFTLAIFTPAIVNAMDNSTVIVNVDADEKKTEKKAETKKEGCTDAKKADCSAEKKAGCCSEAKKADCTGEKKAECTDKKAEKK